MNLKLASGIGATFMIAAIFWAGAAYQRLAGMEAHMASIDIQLQQFVILQRDVATMRAMTDESQRKIEKLDDLVRRLK